MAQKRSSDNNKSVYDARLPQNEIEQAVYELAVGAATTVERVLVDPTGNKTKQITRVKHQPNIEAIKMYLEITESR